MKRACPYDVSLLRMSKVHLMNYDVDLSELHKLQEETVKKVMDGAKISMNLALNSPAPTVHDIVVVSNQKSLKQTEVTSYFNHSINYTPRSDLIKVIDMEVSNEYNSCSYCDRKCETYECGRCKDNYCASCCLSMYNVKADEYVCLSCS